MSPRNWRRAMLLALVVGGGWLFSLAIPWLGFVVGCMAGAFWFRTLQAAHDDEHPGESSPNTAPKEQR